MTSKSSASKGDSLEEAKELALRVLAYHARTEAQLSARLDRAGLGAHVPVVLGWLRHLGYLDDSAFAKGRARELLSPGRFGPRRVELKLRAAGLGAEVARSAVAAAVQERGSELAPIGAAVGGMQEAELSLCRAALERRLRGATLASLDLRGRARLTRFLLGRGFSPGVVGRTLGSDVGSEGDA